MPIDPKQAELFELIAKNHQATQLSRATRSSSPVQARHVQLPLVNHRPPSGIYVKGIYGEIKGVVLLADTMKHKAAEMEMFAGNIALTQDFRKPMLENMLVELERCIAQVRVILKGESDGQQATPYQA
jgi:hypothetical protein